MRSYLIFGLTILPLWVSTVYSHGYEKTGSTREQSAEIGNSSDIDTDFVHESSLSVENEEDILE
jgi:hypothetical protein